jgi:protease-4
MAPSGLLALTGVRAETIYARELLQNVGLEAELLQVGKYKGAADMFTRTEMPPEVRETLGGLLDDLQSDLNSAVRDGRSLDAQILQRAIDEGPHTARSALALKLIDAIAFDDEARANAKTAAQAKDVVVALDKSEDDSIGFGEVFDLVTGSGDSGKVKGKRVVLAYLDGTIGDGESESADGVQSGPFVKAMRRIADDQEVQALVLRISSPGGSALASDKMWHAVKRVAKRKPVIVSIGDMAASGGYYVACAGTEILAEPSSIVGSIGVVGGKIVGEALASKIGVRSTALARGQNANWMSPLTRFSDSERIALTRALDETYAIFLSRVRDGRKLEPAKLDAVAQGRIMSGRRAEQGGLVDRAGGLTEALASARSKASLPADSPVEVWPKERSFLSRLTTAVSGASDHTQLVEHLLPSARELLRHPLTTLLLSGDASPLAVLPLALDIE